MGLAGIEQSDRGRVLAELDLTSDERGAIGDALDPLVRERAGGNGRAVLTSPINIGIGTK